MIRLSIDFFAWITKQQHIIENICSWGKREIVPSTSKGVLTFFWMYSSKFQDVGDGWWHIINFPPCLFVLIGHQSLFAAGVDSPGHRTNVLNAEAWGKYFGSFVLPIRSSRVNLSGAGKFVFYKVLFTNKTIKNRSTLPRAKSQSLVTVNPCKSFTSRIPSDKYEYKTRIIGQIWKE